VRVRKYWEARGRLRTIRQRRGKPERLLGELKSTGILT
jgi:hypothetical protein